MTYMERLNTARHGPLMSDEQMLLLRRLCDEADAPFDPGLCQRRAERRIAALLEDIRLRALPPHTD